MPRPSTVRRVERHAALAYPEIAAFMVELRNQEGVAARGLEFAILTAARTGEVTGARWDQINMAERLWTVPAECMKGGRMKGGRMKGGRMKGGRMKGGREHRVPLSDAALAIIEAMAAIRSGDFVFPSGRANRPLSDMAFLMSLRRLGRGDLTAPGFRSSFRDWAAERTTFPAPVAEMALSHAAADKVEAAYRRDLGFRVRSGRREFRTVGRVFPRRRGRRPSLSFRFPMSLPSRPSR